MAGILATLFFVISRQRRAHRIEIEQKPTYQASFDSLTNLPNRAMANEALESWVQSHLSSGSAFYIMFLELDHAGVEIFMDDFGTGYSSISYLKNFPVKRLKIDRSFISEVTNDYKNASLVTAMVAMGKGLNMQVVAEGVENKEHQQFLKQIDCEFAQGYLYSKPVEKEAFVKLLSSGNNIIPLQKAA